MGIALTSLYLSTNKNKKKVLQEKLNNIKMNKSETVTSYLTRVQQARDELVAVGETEIDSELVKVTLKGCVKHWTTFVDGILVRQQLPNWSQLRDDFFQKEIWENSLTKGQQKGTEEKYELALATQSKKGNVKAKQNQSGGAPSQNKKEKDMSKFKCFACHKLSIFLVSVQTRREMERQLQQPLRRWIKWMKS